MEIGEIGESSSLKTRLSQLSLQASQHSIYRVPRHLRDVNKKAFEPQIVAIGPYYRGQHELKNMEEVKLRYMQALLARKPDVPLEDYISAIDEGMSKRARDCYAEPPINFDIADQFTDMLVLDGCFIIEVTRNPGLFLRTFSDRSSYAFLQRDLILMENQIPFFVLCKLFDLVQGPEQHSLLMKRVLNFCQHVFPGNILYEATTMRSSEEVQHILDLYHSNMEIVEIGESSSLETRLSQLSPQTSQHSIYRVPRHLRDVNKKAFEPQIVAIGPYYRGQHELIKMEEVKLRYMQALVARKPDVSVVDYITAVEGMSKRARDCYAEPPTNFDSASQFTNMLVLDGCFIIEVIQDSKLFLSIFPDRSSYALLQRDLILMENQIPFFVLCKLFDLVQGPEKRSLLVKLVLDFCKHVFPGNILYQATTRRCSEEVQHILDLYHSNWCPPKSTDHYTTSVPVQGCCASTTTISTTVIPSASELKDANVEFRKKEYDSPPDSNIIFREDRCTSLFDVEFNDSGKMVMPTLVIDDETESLLRNLIAYEQLFPGDKPTRFTDYTILLDCLINTSKDVQILCRGKIIENMLGSDQVVVDFVNKLGDGVVFYTDRFIYADTFCRINVHHKKRWNRAVAAFHRDYFHTPWAYIAFLGALTLLLLAAAQTTFSALQVFKSSGSHH